MVSDWVILAANCTLIHVMSINFNLIKQMRGFSVNFISASACAQNKLAGIDMISHWNIDKDIWKVN